MASKLTDQQAEVYRILVEQYELRKEEESFDSDLYGEYNEDHPADDDYCCWDPRYTGPSNYCHCAEYQKEYAKQQRWKNRALRWIKEQFKSFRTWLRRKNIIPPAKFMMTCDYCEKEFDFNKSGLDCPHCGNSNLPF